MKNFKEFKPLIKLINEDKNKRYICCFSLKLCIKMLRNGIHKKNIRYVPVKFCAMALKGIIALHTDSIVIGA